jgi:hypothetical protein
MKNLLKGEKPTPYTEMEITEKIKIKLYEVIGKKYENENEYLKDREKYTWSYFQKLDFQEWFYEQLKKDFKLKKKLLKKSIIKKEELVQFIYKWSDYYGWQDN